MSRTRIRLLDEARAVFAQVLRDNRRKLETDLLADGCDVDDIDATLETFRRSHEQFLESLGDYLTTTWREFQAECAAMAKDGRVAP